MLYMNIKKERKFPFNLVNWLRASSCKTSEWNELEYMYKYIKNKKGQYLYKKELLNRSLYLYIMKTQGWSWFCYIYPQKLTKFSNLDASVA